MDFIRSTSEKMKLWRVEHFFLPFFSRSVLIGGKFIFTKKSITIFAFQCNFNQSALIRKKTGEKVFNWSEVHFFGSIYYEIHILANQTKVAYHHNALICLQDISYPTFDWLINLAKRSKINFSKIFLRLQLVSF